MSAPEPFLPGFHPDPSVCRVGDAYYVVTSTFAYYPGIPVHRSTDLRRWELIGHVLEGETWPEMSGIDLSDGVWAPTIREHEGIFYVVVTLARERRGWVTFVCTATDPSGPWTRTEVEDADGIDPSLYFDDDGRAWFTAARDAVSPEATGPGEIWLREFDLGTLQLRGPEYILWHGAVGGQWVEAPHIYRHEGVYWLLGAEGGTERNHAVTAAHATSITGPYTTDPRSPLLTHRHLGREAALQNVGHADIVTAADGTAWATFLGVRPRDGHHVLGRESFLVPVEWTSEGPVFARGEGLVTADRTERSIDSAADVQWMSLRGPAPFRVRGDDVTLVSSPMPLSDPGTPSFVARRQADHAFTFAATLDSAALGGACAGVVVFQNPRHWISLVLERTDAGFVARVVQREHDVERVVATQAVEGVVRFAIEADADAYRFGVVNDDGIVALGEVAATALSTETTGGFVGVVVGLFARAAEPEDVVFRDVAYRAGVPAVALVS